MGKYKCVSRCKSCNKIYPHGIPEICYKCGARLGIENKFVRSGRLILTSDCEKVIAKRRFFKGWEVKDDE